MKNRFLLQYFQDLLHFNLHAHDEQGRPHSHTEHQVDQDVLLHLDPPHHHLKPCQKLIWLFRGLSDVTINSEYPNQIRLEF